MSPGWQGFSPGLSSGAGCLQHLLILPITLCQISYAVFKCILPTRKCGRVVVVTTTLALIGLLLDAILFGNSALKGILALRSTGMSSFTFKAIAGKKPDLQGPKAIPSYLCRNPTDMSNRLHPRGINLGGFPVSCGLELGERWVNWTP